MVVATVTVVHHEQQSIPSKQRIEAHCTLGSKQNLNTKMVVKHCKFCSSRARLHPVETKDRGYYCTWGVNKT